MSPRIIDNTYYSFGFPNEDWNQLIKRENYLTTIADFLAQGIDLLFIEGAEDSGKTILCAEFVKKHVNDTISVFFNPLNNLDYRLEYYCSNVVCQIKNLLKESPNSEIETALYGIDDYQSNLFNLRRKIRNKKINLVIDGLAEKSKKDPDFVKQLFDIIPFGDIFRIIISGSSSGYLTLSPKLQKKEYKTVALVGFTSTEISQYLSLEKPSPNEMSILYQVTQGYPGRLKTLKRLIQNDKYSLDQITQGTDYSKWIELDCESIDTETPINNAILSLISISDKSFSIEEIAMICSHPFEETKNIIDKLRVLQQTNKTISFVSTSHKKYFYNKLLGNKNDVQELLINYYSSAGSINSLIELPKLHAERNDWGKIISILNDDFLPKILNNTGSLKVVNESIELGVKASEKMNKYNDLWRYSIQGSILNELDNYLFWESEVMARISIQDFAGAISLAESAILKIDRLRLLVLIARKQKEINKKVDEELITLINTLYNSTDLHSIGNKIYNIVSDLIYAIPNLAIEIIEKSSEKTSDRSINDLIVAKLSMAAIDSSLKEKEEIDGSNKIKAIESLNNPSVNKIHRAISFLVGNYSASKVIDEVNKLSDSKERLLLLRLWLNNRPDSTQAEKVIEFALDELISVSTKSLITSDILKELSYQLPYIKDRRAKRHLIDRFRRIEKNVKDVGLTKNKHIYKLNMFHALLTLDTNDASYSIKKMLIEIDSIEDVLIKLDSFSEVYSKLCIVKRRELKGQLDFVYSRVITLSKELFSTTAFHYKISQHLLKTISRRNPHLGLIICNLINTQERRERSRLLILDSYLSNNLKYIDIDLLKELENSLEVNSSKKSLYVKILERYSESKNLHYKIIEQLLYYAQKVDGFEDPEEKVLAYLLVYKIISKNITWKGRLSKKFEILISKTWQEIEADWERINIGFTICSDLAEINFEYSKIIFEETNKIKKESWIDSEPIAYTYLNSIKLILKAYSGLLISKNERPEDYKLIETLIRRIPSDVIKTKLWTEIGLQSYLAKRDDVARDITEHHVILLIQSILAKQTNIESALDSFTLIHLYNSKLANDLINKISDEHKEIVFCNISDFYITKRNPFEPYDREINKYNSLFMDLDQAVGILERINTDSHLYYELQNACEAIVKAELSEIQVNELSERLDEIVNSKLPDAKNIKHNGYLLLAQAKVAKLKKKGIDHNVFWLKIINEANKIPNTSDQVYVKSILLDDIPFERIKDGKVLKTQLYTDIITIIEDYKVHYEFVQRVVDISSTMYNIDRTRWKGIVNKAFTISSDLEQGSEIYASQKQIIDSMYRIDSAYAKELMKQVDKSNIKNNLAERLHEHFESLEIANKIKNNLQLDQKEKENYRKIVRGVYAALKSLNSERITTKKVNEISNYLSIGNKLPLHEVYPIFAYYLGNCAITYRQTKLEGAVADIHRNNFEEAVNATNLIELLSHRRKASERSFNKYFIDENFTSNKVLKPGSKEEAMEFIRNWLQDEADTFVIIADPYFRKEDLEILKSIKSAGKDLDISILGSEHGSNINIETEFKDYWKKISDEIPPYTNITFCWIPESTNQKPFHDRWIITKNGGIRLGTSINSLGKKRESELSVMQPNEAFKIREEALLEYIERKKRESNNCRIYYKSFTL